MPSPAAILNIVITANASAAQANLAKTQAQMKAVAATADKSALATAGAWQKAGRRMNSIGKTMTRTISLPAAAIGAASVKMAMDFEHSMSLIQTQAGGSAAEVKNLSKQVMDFAATGRSTHGPKELADALYHIESVGYRGAKAMRILKSAEALATTGAADMEETTNALVSAMRTGIKGTQNLEGTIGSLNAIIGAGNMRMDDLNAAMGTGFLSNARQMGLSLNQAGAALAALTRQGQPAVAGATRLSMAFRMVMAPTDKAAKALKSIGLSAGQLGTMMQAGKFPEAMHLLVQRLDALGNSPEALQKKAQIIREMFGARSSTGINTILQGLHQYDQTLTQVNQKSADFNKLHGAAMQTPANRLHAIWAQLQVTLIKLGETLMPTILRLAKVVESLASAFNSIPGFARDLLLGAIVLGPMIRMVGLVLQLASAWKAVAAAQAVSGVTGAAAGGGAALGGAGGMFGIGGAAARAGAGGAAGGIALGAGGALLLGGAIAGTAVGGVYAAKQNFGKASIAGEAIVAANTEKKIEALIAQRKAAEGGLTAALAHQVELRIIQLAREHKVSAKWAGEHVKDMRNVEAGSHGVQSAIQTMVNLGAKNFAHLGKTAKFEVDKMMTALLTGKDPINQIASSFTSMAERIKNAMNKGKVSVKEGTAMINRLMAQEMELLGMKPIPGGFVSAKTGAGRSGGKGTAQGPVAHRQRGGFLPGPSRGDNIPLLAEGGEFMVNAKATRRFLPLLENINRAVPRFAGGGQIPGFRGTSPGVIDDLSAAALNLEAKAARVYLARMKKKYGAGNVQALMREARRMESLRQPYVWGGGHAGFSRNGPWDCSGAVSQLLHGAGYAISSPMVSGGFMKYGLPGLAGNNTGIWANPSHVWATINGQGFSTSAENPGGGWGSVSYNSRPGFVKRHGVSNTKGQAQAPGYQHGGIVGNWNKNQLTTLASYVGMRNPALMAAIAMAESRGNPSARGAAGEYGLWQIMPSWGGGSSLLDPIKNARKARYVLGKQGLTAWTTYKTGAYKRFLGGHVLAGLMARLRGGGRGGGTNTPGVTGSFGQTDLQPYNPDAYQAMVDAIDAQNQIIGTMNDLIGAGNLEALQRYQTGLAQNPVLGIPSPNAPGLTPLRPTLPTPPPPSFSITGMSAEGFGYGLRGYTSPHHAPKIHNHFYIEGKEIKGVTKVEMRKAARKGRRGLPSGRR